MKLTIDFETRSIVDIKKQGAWVYAEHPLTEILCLAFKLDEWKSAELWTPRSDAHQTKGLKELMARVDTIEAHNLSFEYAIWKHIMTRVYGFDPLPVAKLRCSAAKASMHGLPRSLEQACRALGLPLQKDMTGHRIMMKLCKPRMILNSDRKLYTRENGWVEGDGYFEDLVQGRRMYLWHEDAADYAALYEYCKRDVLAEEALSNALRDLPPVELAVWRLDQKINARGIQADIPGCQAMMEFIDQHEYRLLKELAKLTNGAVRTAKQIDQLRGYLLGLGLDLPDLTAATISAALQREDLTDDSRRILEIRQSLGRSSSSKYQAIIQRASADGRIRGSLLYHGAGTGRWSGAGIQPHNFSSRIPVESDPVSVLSTIRLGGLPLFDALYTDDPMAAAGAITRSVLVSTDGADLVAADYSAVEDRGLAWLAGETWVLDAYRANKDMYVAAAASILKIPEGEVTKAQRQNPGKIAELACGYQGGAGAVRKFGGGAGMDDEEIKAQIVNPWRAARPKTVEFWAGLEDACKAAVNNPGRAYEFRFIGFRVQGEFLMMRLPSGRLLYYYDPRIMDVKTPWDEMRPQVTYMNVNSLTHKWERTNTYGGKLAENATQAICRDIMASAMLRLESAGYPIVLTVHDEIVSEVPEGFGSVEEYVSIMCDTPAWAAGFPVSAEGWRGKRYRK